MSVVLDLESGGEILHVNEGKDAKQGRPALTLQA